MVQPLSETVADLFRNHRALENLRERVRTRPGHWWLVGGCLRDLLLGRLARDIDIVSTADPSDAARDWARAVRGHWFWLDADRRYSRVLLDSGLQVDFSPLRATPLEADLRLRDFTINALAFPLCGEDLSGPLSDPLNGCADLASGQLRCCSQDSYADDPLRMLKGIRHAVTLNFSLVGTALEELRRQASSLGTVAGERIREELLAILDSPAPVQGLQLLWDNGLLVTIWGAAGPSWRASAAWSDLRTFRASLDRWPQVPGDGSWPAAGYRALFLLARFLGHYRPAELSVSLHQRLRMSRAQQRLILRLLSEDPGRPELFHRLPELRGRRQALAVECLQPCAEELLFYQGVGQGQLDCSTAVAACDSFREAQRRGRVPDRLSGERVAALTGASGRTLGDWQRRIKQAEINGEIHNSEDAEQWLQGKISFDKGKN